MIGGRRPLVPEILSQSDRVGAKFEQAAITPKRYEKTQSTIEPLQRVQNAAARLIFNLGRKEHVTPCLIQLHWLPVQFRITYKLCVKMHYIHVGKAPCYLSDAL